MSTYTILLFIVVLATFVYFPEKQKEQVTEALEVKVESTVQMLAIGISLALDEGDYDLIQKVFNLTQADTNIAYIAVLDEIGDEIISFNPNEIQKPNIIQYSPKNLLEEQEMIFVTKRLLIEDDIYGNLVIGYSLKGRNETIARIRWTALWLSLAIFLVAMIISDFISRQITNPIKNVVESLKDIGRAETYGKKIEKSSTDEIGALIDGFNDMSAKIHTRTEELQLKIIDLKKAEEEKGKLQERLKQSERMESLGLLAGGVAHDLNNIIVPIMAYPDLIKMALAEGKSVDKHLDTIMFSAQRAADVIADLLALTRRGNYKMEPIDLNDLVNDYLSSAECKLTKSLYPEVSSDIQLSESTLLFKGSKAHLPKVFMNLINNAFESMPEGGVLSISTSSINVEDRELSDKNLSQGRYNLLTIEDQGEGISEENISKIFDPFFTTKIKTGKSGTGLGLSVVYNVLRDHGAHVDVESKLGIGTKFSIYFPETTEKKETTQKDKQLQKGSGSILVVDDRQEQRDTAVQILTTLGYDVESVESGQDAIDYLEKADVDLIWLDMILEDEMDGLDTYIEIIKTNPDQKTIIVSGYGESDRMKQAEKLGVNGFIQKPYKIDKIGRIIQIILGNSNN